MTKITLSLIIAISLLTIGCAVTSKPYTPVFSEIEQNNISRLKVLSFVEQNQINAQYTESSSSFGFAGGVALGAIGQVIGSVVDSAVDSKTKNPNQREKFISSSRSMISKYNAKATIHNKLQTAVKELEGPTSEFIIEPTAKRNRLNIEDFISNFNEESLLLLDTSYSFDPTFNFIHVICDAHFYMKNITLKGGLTEAEGKEKLGFTEKKWRVQYQTPRRVLRHKTLNQDEINFAIEKITDEYNQILDKERDHEKRVALIRAKNKKISRLKKTRTKDIIPPLTKEPWEQEVLLKELEKAFQAVSVEVLRTLTLSITSEEFLNRKIVIPERYYSISASSTIPIIHTWHVNAVKLENNIEDYSTFLTAAGDLYVVPSGEASQRPTRVVKN